jgi:hypothetical protein
MLVTMKNSDLMDQLISLAGGDIKLVSAAIHASAKGPEEEADLKEVVEYILQHRVPEPAAA